MGEGLLGDEVREGGRGGDVEDVDKKFGFVASNNIEMRFENSSQVHAPARMTVRTLSALSFSIHSKALKIEGLPSLSTTVVVPGVLELMHLESNHSFR